MSWITLKKLMRTLASVFMSLFLLFAVSACKGDFEEVDTSLIQSRWEESIKHSAVSWWYLGEKDGYHFIVEKWPLERHRYKVNKKNLHIEIGAPKELTFDKNEWVNFKVGQVQFK